MEVKNIILVSVYAAFGIYVIYRLFFKKDKGRDEYERLYKEILTSDKYKVKGQHDK